MVDDTNSEVRNPDNMSLMGEEIEPVQRDGSKGHNHDASWCKENQLCFNIQAGSNLVSVLDNMAGSSASGPTENSTSSTEASPNESDSEFSNNGTIDKINGSNENGFAACLGCSRGCKRTKKQSSASDESCESSL